MEKLLEGIKREMKARGWTQDEFAKKTEVSYVTISRYFNLKQRPSERWIELAVKALGKSQDALVRGTTLAIQSTSPTDYSDPEVAMEIVGDALTGVIRHLKKTTARLNFWQAVVEELPTPSLIINHEKVVVFQNRRSREWGILSGGELCHGCISGECDRKECAVMEAVESGIEVSGYKWLGDKYYKVHCTPFRNDGNTYFLVVATEINTAGKIIRSFEKMRDERKFLSEQQFELPEYYADVDRRVTYINKAFGDVLGVDHQTINTTDDLFAIITSKLFSPKKILGMAQAVRENFVEAYSPAKLQGSNEMLHFFFKPHMEGDDFRGVHIVILDQDTYEFQQRRGVL